MNSVKVGDIVRIGTFQSQLVVGHYVHADDQGPFIQLYNCDLQWTPQDGLAACNTLFTPILVGIGHAIRSGRWERLGNVTPQRFQYPRFLMHAGGVTWYLFDGKREKLVGSVVPPELRTLETLTVWSAELLEERLASGENPFSYEAISRWPTGPRGLVFTQDD